MHAITVIFVGTILTLSIFVQSAHGYPTSIDQAVPAKWNDLYFSICIFNYADAKYQKLFIKAIEEWKKAWPHFSYMVREKQAGCDINVDITKYSVGITKERHSQGTTYITYWKNSHISSADIAIPTQIKKEVKQGEYCCIPLIYEISEKRFYLTSLHEFGHALGLGHAEDNGEEPFDVMRLMGEHPKHVISSVTVKALDKIYNTSTEAMDRPIELKPSVTLEIKMDKDTYVLDDTIKVSGKVSKPAGIGRIMLFTLPTDDSLMSLHTAIDFIPNNDGSFSVNVELRTNYSGKWVLLAQYSGVSRSLLFDVEEIPYGAFGETDKTTYSIGDVVKINGNVTRYGDKVYIDVINPDGITVIHKTTAISYYKKFDTEFTLRESKFTIEGEWVARLSYADTTNDITFHVAANS